jgi:hypothetical protein
MQTSTSYSTPKKGVEQANGVHFEPVAAARRHRRAAKPRTQKVADAVKENSMEEDAKEDAASDKSETSESAVVGVVAIQGPAKADCVGHGGEVPRVPIYLVAPRLPMVGTRKVSKNVIPWQFMGMPPGSDPFRGPYRRCWRNQANIEFQQNTQPRGNVKAMTPEYVGERNIIARAGVPVVVKLDASGFLRPNSAVSIACALEQESEWLEEQIPEWVARLMCEAKDRRKRQPDFAPPKKAVPKKHKVAHNERKLVAEMLQRWPVSAEVAEVTRGLAQCEHLLASAVQARSLTAALSPEHVYTVNGETFRCPRSSTRSLELSNPRNR